MDVQTDGPAVCRAHGAISGLREGSGRRCAFFPGGPDGLRPQHLLDLLYNEKSSAAFLASLTDFINVLLRGECPKQMSEIMFGGSLIALSEKVRGLRPIVIGYTYRRLAAKCANRYALGRLDSFFAPLQVGWRSQGAEKQQYMRQEASSQI